MSFKTGGFKTKYHEVYGYIDEEYTIYCALESCTNVCVYKMFDKDGKERDLCVGAEDDTDDYGSYSLIDCLYYLKRHENKKYKYNEHDIIIEDMTNEEVKKIFDN